MEYIDILDNNGNKTNEAVSINDIHKFGFWHRTAHVWVVNSKKEILLQHRHTNSKNFPEKWDVSVGGHISHGDNSLDCAIRETQEEIGLDVLPEDLKYIGEIIFQIRVNDGAYIENEFNDIYLINLDMHINDFKMQEGEVKDLRWVSFEDFKKMVIEKSDDLVPHHDEYDLLIKELEKQI